MLKTTTSFELKTLWNPHNVSDVLVLFKMIVCMTFSSSNFLHSRFLLYTLVSFVYLLIYLLNLRVENKILKKKILKTVEEKTWIFKVFYKVELQKL